MKHAIIFLLFVGLMPQASWQIDQENSQVRFEISNFGLNTVEGTIKGMEGDVRFFPAALAQSRFDVRVDVSTIDTGVEARDEHLRKEDYFFVEQYPAIRFQSEKVTQAEDGSYETVGTLTMRGVSQKVTMPFTAEKVDSGYLLQGTFTIQRKDFEVGGGNTFSVGNDVEITVICRLVEG